MKTIAHLITVSRKSRIGKGPPTQVGIEPIGKNPLVWPAELTRPGQKATAVDPNRQPESLGVLQRQVLRSQLRATVERKRWISDEIFRNTVRGETRRAAVQQRGPVGLL